MFFTGRGIRQNRQTFKIPQGFWWGLPLPAGCGRFNPGCWELWPQEWGPTSGTLVTNHGYYISKKSPTVGPTERSPAKTWVSNSPSDLLKGSVGKVPFDYWWNITTYIHWDPNIYSFSLGQVGPFIGCFFSTSLRFFRINTDPAKQI